MGDRARAWLGLLRVAQEIASLCTGGNGQGQPAPESRRGLRQVGEDAREAEIEKERLGDRGKHSSVVRSADCAPWDDIGRNQSDGLKFIRFKSSGRDYCGGYPCYCRSAAGRHRFGFICWPFPCCGFLANRCEVSALGAIIPKSLRSHSGGQRL